MEKIYPILKRAVTELGQPLPEGYIGLLLAYCPVCNKRLSAKKVDPKNMLQSWEYERRKQQSHNGMVGKPIYCEKCGTLIHPVS